MDQLCHSVNFNPRSREGSDAQWIDDQARQGISIHAPVKGATVSMSTQSAPVSISIHAPVKGATINIFIWFILSHFNPRSREGSDAALPMALLALLISIHAPVKGATSDFTMARFVRQFQSTLP